MRHAAILNIAVAALDLIALVLAALVFAAAVRRSVLCCLLRWRARCGPPLGSASPADLRAVRGAFDRRGELDQPGVADRRAEPPLPPQRHVVPLRHAALRALARQEFALCYQPMLDLRSGRVVGARALLRWRHPERGLLAPAEFIDEFEQSGLTLQVGAWALATAAAQAARWIEQGCSLAVSLPLSARQFFQPDLAVDFAAVLRQAGLPACHIELAVDLATLIDRQQDCEAILERLRRCGVGLSIRDASCRGPFNYLRRFAVDALWLDATAADGVRLQAAPGVEDAPAPPLPQIPQMPPPAPQGGAAAGGGAGAHAGADAGPGAGAEAALEAGAQAPLRAAIALAHALGRRVVAGPVATPAQLARLAALGCDQAYGDAVGATVAAEALVAAFRAGAPAWPLRAATPTPAPSAAADAVHRPADSACR